MSRTPEHFQLRTLLRRELINARHSGDTPGPLTDVEMFRVIKPIPIPVEIPV